MTVVFCDLAGSTALGESTDPEALRALLARYFERVKGIIESHGGSVEKFIGDAVMAVFGVPVAHEDDALRACRAAVEMRDAFPDLGIAGRIGVNTGEVVTGTMERLATGDAVNVAARLEQAANPAEVLVGAETLRLVRAAVEVGEERLLAVKGKAESVPAYPLLGVRGELERAFATPMVGREHELARLAPCLGRRCTIVPVSSSPSSAHRASGSLASTHGGKTFDQTYGTNADQSNAFGKCVSQTAKAASIGQEHAIVRAARTCKAEQKSNPAACKAKYKTFGRCVRTLAKSK